MSRSADRAGFDVPARLHLVERDVDTLEADTTEAIAELKADVKAMRRVLTGMLVSITTAAILLAVNAAILGGIR